MEAERWQKVKALFDVAIELAPEKRQRFLDNACAADDDLRRAVEKLLASFDDAEESFLEQPAVKEVAEQIAVDAETEELQTKKSFGHYQIIRQIGAGGMGEVYLAKDTRLDRQVAIKILSQTFNRKESDLRRFTREAKAASALNHPNILVIHEIGREDDEDYIVSEFIAGKTLRETMSESPFQTSEILDVIIQIVNALAAAHAVQIIHRDIKPENIMLRPDGYVKILDFGLAKLVEQKKTGFEDQTTNKSLTAKGIVMGTVNYMSPEQAKGEQVDERTDIFSLGALLYEMIAGKTPFAGNSLSETFANLINAEPPPLSRFSPDVPSELQRIVAKMLRKNKTERYQTMTDLLIDLKEARRGLEFEGKLERTTLEHREKPQTQMVTRLTTNATQLAKQTGVELKTAVALGIIVLVAASLWFFFGRQSSFTAITVKKTIQHTTWLGLDDFPSMSPDGNSVAYCSNHTGSFEIYVKSLTSGANEIQLTNDGQQNFEPAWSPNGQHIAYYSKLRGGIWIIPASGGEARQLTDSGSYPAWSPDGKQIVFQSNPLNDLGTFARNGLPPSTLWLVSATGGEPRQLTQLGNPSGGHSSPAWSPDGKRIAFEANTSDSSAIWTVSAAGDDAKRVSPVKPSCYAPVYAPDGNSIFYHSGDVFQQGINSNTGEIVGEPMQIAGIATRPSVSRRISFSADGKKIAFNVLRRSESISSITLKAISSEADNAPNPIVSNATGRNNYPAFSPDGSRLAFASCGIGGAGCDIWLANSDGSNQTQLTTAESNELIPNWFPDGKQIAYITDRTGYYSFWAIDLNTKRERLLFDLKQPLEYVRLSPDGKQVIFNLTKDGVINVWTASLDIGEPQQLTFDKELAGFPSWSPDGKYIAFQMKRGNDTHVMIMPSEGGGAPTQLTFDKGQSWIYGWSPDGDKILFAGFRNGIWNVWWVSRSTKKEQQLTDYKKLNSFVRYPSWSPDGKQVVYEYSETTGNIWVANLK